MNDKNYKKKIKTAEEISKIIGSRPRSKNVIMCHGNFDIVHPGHVRHLMFASSNLKKFWSDTKYLPYSPRYS